MLCTSVAWGQNGESPGHPSRTPHSRDNNTRAASASAITVTESTGMTPEQLVSNVFLGDGVHISNVKFNGVNTSLTSTTGAQLGTFTANTTDYTYPTNFFENGLIMTTGKITTAVGPNDTGSESNSISGDTPACSELAALIPGYSVNKPAVLEFDFVTVAEHIQFNYVFASEEYPEWAGSNYNDVFGFFVTDMVTNTTQNIALIPGTNIPVAINNIHSATGSSYTSVAAYEQYYHTIPSNSPLMQYDAYDGPFVAEMDVVPCRNYHMKLAIANVGDNSYDSGVFLEAASFSASVLNEVVNFEYSGHQYIVAGCYGADVTFTLPHAVENDSIIVLHYGGSALNGVNVELLPDIIEMPAGDSTYTLHITGIDNGQNNNDTLILTIQYENSVCTATQEGKIDIYIVQDSGIELSSQDISTCGNLTSMSVNVVYGEATDIMWSPSTNLTNPHGLTTGFINPPTETTQYTVTASDQYGCKTTSTTFTLTYAPTETQEATEHVCQGTHYTGHGLDITPTEPGTITESIEITASGSDCAGTLNLTLIVDPTPENTIAVTECDSYTWDNGTQLEYTQSGVYDFVTPTANGCDSTVHLDLTINNSKTSEFNAEGCNSYTWDGTTYSQSGDFVRSYQTTQGCDSIVTMHLTLGLTLTHEFSVTECDSYTWDGTEYTTSNDYVNQYTSVDGCDSVVTLHLTINNSNHNGTATATACESYTWNGQTYTESGVYTYPTQTVQGCDSTATLNLTINYADQSTTSVTECDSYTWNGQTYNESGTYTYSTQTTLGCDSTAILNLTINNSEYPEMTQAACETYTWHNTEYTQSGDYTYETTTEQGCNKVETLHLTIDYPEYPEFTETACDSYNWNGTEYTNSGTYTYETTTQAGCLRVETLYLTVNHSDQSTMEMTECDNYFWNGVNYTQSGQYEYHTQTVLGCDSIVHLNLTINNSEYPVENINYCDNYLWNGQEYNHSGTYTYETTTSAGCERIETLNLTIVETPNIVIDGDHFPIGGSETSFSIYNYEIVPQNSSTVFDSVVWHMDNINWYIDPHNNGMDVDLHIFTWIPDTVQLIATAYNECGSHTYIFWIHTSYYDIEEHSQDNSINILPNPNNGNMNFEFNDFKDEAMVKVIDNNGNLVDTFTINRSDFRYEMTPKASGTYHFVITHDGKVTTKRIVIVK